MEQHQHGTHVAILAHQLPVLTSEGRQAGRHHRRWAEDGHEEVAALRVPVQVKELVDVEAVEDPIIGIDLTVEDAAHKHRRVQVQVASGLASWIGEAAVQPKLSGVDRTRRQYYSLAVNGKSVRRTAVWCEQTRRHSCRPSIFGKHGLSQAVCVESSAGLQRLGNVGHGHTLLSGPLSRVWTHPRTQPAEQSGHGPRL